MGPWITDAELKEIVADALDTEVDELPSRYDRLVPAANSSATQDITTALKGRGYSIAQIDAWDRRIEFNKDLGLYWCLIRGHATGTYSDVMINKLDRRKELVTITITTGGDVEIPDDDGTDEDGSPFDGGGGISGGHLDETDWRITRDTVF